MTGSARASVPSARAIGLDVGSTTAKLVVVDARGEVLLRRCQRHHGRPAERARALLEEGRALAPDAVVGASGSAGVALASALGAVAVHEIPAMVRAVRARWPAARTLVELGGQDAKLVWLDGADAAAEMNDRCAAGTGATIDRVLRRLAFDPARLAEVALEGDARVAAKCGVFAETDVANLVARGASPEHALAALARAIVAQNLAVLARGRTLSPPVLLLGGPHAHFPALRGAWREALREHWSLRGVALEGDADALVSVPAHADTLVALGAALHALAGAPPLARARKLVGGREGARVEAGLVRAGEEPRLLEPLGAAPDASTREATRAWLGLDAGSTSTKAVLVGERGELLASSYALSSGDPIADARRRLDAVLDRGAHDVVGLAVTGYGAELLREVLGADLAVLETSAHARAAHEAMPGVECVVDVGGTDVKILRLRDGAPRDFRLSTQCTAGYGAFLATAAAELGVDMGSFAARAMRAARAPRFGVGCAVFLDTDRVTFQRDGFSVDEILAGLAQGLPRNVWELIVGESPARSGRSFLLTGGAHRNAAAALAHARYLRERVPGARVAVHPTPELCGAIGAALALRDRQRAAPPAHATMRASAEERPRPRATPAGLRVHVESGEAAACTRCELRCERSIVRVSSSERPERTVVLGHGCERGADAASTGRRKRTHATDLLAEEARRLFAPVLPPPPPRARPLARPPVVGIPRVMALYRCAPFLLHYLRAAGVPGAHLELSPPSSPELFRAGARWAANDPCFPAKLVPAHVDWLLRRHAERPLDVLLAPTFTHALVPVRGTVDTASCPIVAGCGHAAFASLRRERDRFTDAGVRALSPTLTLTDRARLEGELLEAFGELLELDADENRRALEHALLAQRTHQARLRRRGVDVLARAGAEGRPAVVVLARPYHADPGIQHGVSTELAARGLAVLGISSLPLESAPGLDLSGTLPSATNSGSAERAWAARVVAATPGLYAAELSSFRCGQDASAQSIVDDLLGDDKPALRLHDVDEHRPALSMRLRIETFVEAVARHHGQATSARAHGAGPTEGARV